ncbi:MAG: hypothetical protein ACJ8EY_11915 [Sphingomicrobium sp.]
MDKIKAANAPEMEDGSFSTAESVRSDFDQLIAVLDRRLANLSEADKEFRAHIVDARDTAVRGLKLSEELMEALRSSVSS